MIVRSYCDATVATWLNRKGEPRRLPLWPTTNQKAPGQRIHQDQTRRGLKVPVFPRDPPPSGVGQVHPPVPPVSLQI